MGKIPKEIAYNGLLYESPELSHNAIYRGNSLGAFTDSYASTVASMRFTDIYVGDTFTQNGNTYKIGGLNYLLGADNNDSLPPHLLMITNNLTERAMNPSDTTRGGFAGSDMWKSYFPTVIKQLQTDFGSHLLTWNEYLTTGTDGKAANQGAFFPVQASMMNTAMYWGSPNPDSKPASDGKDYNTGIEIKQLPIMKLHPDEQKGGTDWTWLRDVYDSKQFALTVADGTPNYFNASSSYNVRAFFLID